MPRWYAIFFRFLALAYMLLAVFDAGVRHIPDIGPAPWGILVSLVLAVAFTVVAGWVFWDALDPLLKRETELAPQPAT